MNHITINYKSIAYIISSEVFNNFKLKQDEHINEYSIEHIDDVSENDFIVMMEFLFFKLINSASKTFPSDDFYEKCCYIIDALNITCMYESFISNSDNRFIGSIMVDLFYNNYNEYRAVINDIGFSNIAYYSNYGEELTILHIGKSTTTLKIPNTVMTVNIHVELPNLALIRIQSIMLDTGDDDFSINYFISSKSNIKKMNENIDSLYGDNSDKVNIFI